MTWRVIYGGLYEKARQEKKSAVIRATGEAQSAKMIGRALHSSTLQLNLSAFCVTGGAVRGCFGGV
jgi:hypothetical protein